MTRTLLATVLLAALGLPSALQAQSLADAANAEAARRKVAEPAKKVYTNADVPSVDTTATPAAAGDAATPTADDVVDKSKFDKVYATGKVVDEAQLMSAVGVTLQQFQQFVLAFSTEVSVARDKATTKAEKSLADKYAMAYTQYSFGGLQVSSPIPDTQKKGLDAMKKASDLLEAANKIYLGK